MPIVAMTAHAIQGAKEECLQTGMNDYVSKPIDPEQLFAVLARWLKPPAGTAEPRTRVQRFQPVGADFDSRLPDSLPGIDTEAGLKRLNGNHALYRQLLFDFSAKYCSAAEEIRKILAKEDPASALRLAHTLKGISGNLSMDGVQATLKGLEEAIAGQSPAEIDRHLDQLAVELQRVQLSLSRLTAGRKNEAEQDSAIDPARAGAILRELATLLREDSLDAGQCLENLKKYLGLSRFKKELEELEGYIRNFDFDCAKQPLQRIARGLNPAVEEEI